MKNLLIKFKNINKINYKFNIVVIKKGDYIFIEYYTENKYKQSFSGICIGMYGSYFNKRIKVFNLDEKIQSIFFFKFTKYNHHKSNTIKILL
jgi:hypothetical protein